MDHLRCAAVMDAHFTRALVHNAEAPEMICAPLAGVLRSSCIPDGVMPFAFRRSIRRFEFLPIAFARPHTRPIGALH